MWNKTENQPAPPSSGSNDNVAQAPVQASGTGDPKSESNPAKEREKGPKATPGRIVLYQTCAADLGQSGINEEGMIFPAIVVRTGLSDVDLQVFTSTIIIPKRRVQFGDGPGQCNWPPRA